MAINSFNNLYIPVYILPELNSDVADESLREFNSRPEFDIRSHCFDSRVTNNIETWKVLQKIVEEAFEEKDDVIILCKDTHKFPSSYNKRFLFSQIISAFNLDADILCFHVSGFESVFFVDNNIFWLDYFNESKFFVLYHSIFKNILEENLSENETIYQKLSSVTMKKFAVHPFISQTPKVRRELPKSMESDAVKANLETLKLEILKNILRKHVEQKEDDLALKKLTRAYFKNYIESRRQ